MDLVGIEPTTSSMPWKRLTQSGLPRINSGAVARYLRSPMVIQPFFGIAAVYFGKRGP